MTLLAWTVCKLFFSKITEPFPQESHECALKLIELWNTSLLFDLDYKFKLIGASLLALAKSIYYFITANKLYEDIKSKLSVLEIYVKKFKQDALRHLLRIGWCKKGLFE